MYCLSGHVQVETSYRAKPARALHSVFRYPCPLSRVAIAAPARLDGPSAILHSLYTEHPFLGTSAARETGGIAVEIKVISLPISHLGWSANSYFVPAQNSSRESRLSRSRSKFFQIAVVSADFFASSLSMK